MKMAFSSFFCYSNENKIILFWFFQIIERKVLDSFSNLLDRPLQYAIIFKRKKENSCRCQKYFQVSLSIFWQSIIWMQHFRRSWGACINMGMQFSTLWSMPLIFRLAIFVLLVLLVLTVTTILFCRMALYASACSESLMWIVIKDNNVRWILRSQCIFLILKAFNSWNSNPKDGEDMKHYDYAVKTDQVCCVSIDCGNEIEHAILSRRSLLCPPHHHQRQAPVVLWYLWWSWRLPRCSVWYFIISHPHRYCAIHLYENILKSSSFPEDMHEALTDGFLTTDEEYKRIASTLDNRIYKWWMEWWW